MKYSLLHSKPHSTKLALDCFTVRKRLPFLSFGEKRVRGAEDQNFSGELFITTVGLSL